VRRSGHEFLADFALPMAPAPIHACADPEDDKFLAALGIKP
jgi:hypothetical protein